MPKNTKLIARNYGAVMAVSAGTRWGYFNTIEDLGFFKNDRTDIRIFQTQHTRQVVAVEWSVGGHRVPADTAITAP
jgi:hypothetical protein